MLRSKLLRQIIAEEHFKTRVVAHGEIVSRGAGKKSREAEAWADGKFCSLSVVRALLQATLVILQLAPH